ncbi:hypothetical protein KEJ39_04390 [Candidatus Bathyarchaeota archaeon]|nr:hypothetical protein [Candidatus Bathyarchaeota archaeon]
MTHTLHRSGSVETLSIDYPVLVIAAQGINSKNSAPKFRKALEIILKHNPVNFGDMKTGNYFRKGLKPVLSNTRENSIVHGVFTNRKDLEECLDELRNADLGLSVVVSGLFSEVWDSLKKIGLNPHSLNISLGVWGKKELLPEQTILDITTMCGHHCVSPLLVKKMLSDIKRDKISVEGAARELAKPCVCGVFNTLRAERLLEEMMART